MIPRPLTDSERREVCAKADVGILDVMRWERRHAVRGGERAALNAKIESVVATLDRFRRDETQLANELEEGLMLPVPQSGTACLQCGDPECAGGDACPATQQGLIHWIDDRRKAKVKKLLAAVPLPGPISTNETIANALEAYSTADRKWFAKRAGARKPSDTTWGLLVEAVRRRGT